MGILNAFANQLGSMLRSQSASRRVLLLFLILGTIGLMTWLAFRAHTGGYVVLIPNLQPGEAGEAVMRLRQVGIQGQLDTDGGTLKVPRNRADDAAVFLAMEGIPSSGTVGMELMDKSSVGQTQFQQEKNYHRMREGELARTLLAIREIERARVHLALPEDTLYDKDRQKPTASVVIKVRRGMNLNEHQVRGIIHLVSHSVEGLAPEDVSIIDGMGNLLNPSEPDKGALATAAQQSFKTQFEDQLKKNVETMLENVIGKGRVSTRVQADFDFSTMRQVRETVNPEDQEQQIQHQQTTQEVLSSRDTAAGVKGAPGSASNLPDGLAPSGGAAGPAGAPGKPMRSDTTTQYALSRQWQESSESVPKPTRVSVAVLVDGNYEEIKTGDESKLEYRDRPAAELDKLRTLVEAAIGFTNNDQRQDVVQLSCAQFKIEEPEGLDGSKLSYQTRRWIELGVEWGVVGLIGLLLILMVLRPAVKTLVSPALLEARMLPAGYAGKPAGHAGLPAGHAGVLGDDGADAGSEVGAARYKQIRTAAGLNPVTGALELPDMEGMEALELPPGINPNSEAARQLQMQHLAAQQAKMGQAQAQRVHQEVVDTAKNDPKKTVGLLRQWMEEA